MGMRMLPRRSDFHSELPLTRRMYASISSVTVPRRTAGMSPMGPRYRPRRGVMGRMSSGVQRMVLARRRAAPATLRLLAKDGIVPIDPILELASVVHPPMVVLASVVQPSVSDDGKVALVGGDGRGSLGGGLAGEGDREERRDRTFKDDGF